MQKENGHEVNVFNITESEQVMLMRLVNAAYEHEMPVDDQPGIWEVRPLGMVLNNAEHNVLESLFNKIVLGF